MPGEQLYKPDEVNYTSLMKSDFLGNQTLAESLELEQVKMNI